MYNENDDYQEKPKRREKSSLFLWARDVIAPLILGILGIFAAGAVVTIIYAPEFVVSITQNILGQQNISETSTPTLVSASQLDCNNLIQLTNSENSIDAAIAQLNQIYDSRGNISKGDWTGEKEIIIPNSSIFWTDLGTERAASLPEGTSIVVTDGGWGVYFVDSSNTYTIPANSNGGRYITCSGSQLTNQPSTTSTPVTTGLSCNDTNATCVTINSKDMTGKASYISPTTGTYTISIIDGSYNVYGNLDGWWRTRIEGFINKNMSTVQRNGQIGPISDFFVGNDEVETQEIAERMWQGKSRTIELQEGDVLNFTAKDTWSSSAYRDNEGEVTLHIQAPN